MTTLKFADTYNMVAFLAKLAESEGFEQIAKTVNGEVQLQALVDGKNIIITKLIVRRDLQLEDAEGVDCLPNATIFEQLTLMGPKRKDTEVPHHSGPTTNVADEAVNKEMDDSLVRAVITASSLEAEQDSGNTLRSGEDSLKLQELMALCTTLQSRVLNLETIKTTQANEIASLKKRVKKLKQKKRSRTHGLKILYKVGSSRRVESSDEEGLGKEDASKQGRIADIDANKNIYLVNVHTDEDMFGVNDLDGDEVIVDNVNVVKTAEETRSVVEEVTDVIEKAKLVSVAEETVNAAATIVSIASTIPVSVVTTTTVSDVEITLAQALAELKSAKRKADKVVIQEPEQGTTTTTLTTTVATTITTASTRPKVKGIVIHEQEQAPTPTVSSQQPSLVKVQDKGKGKMLEPEPVTKMSKKDLLRLDEELAFKLQAEKEEKRLAREKAQQIEKPNIAWDDVQAKIEADYQLAQRLQAQEQEELTDEEKARLFVQFLEQRRKHFAAKRAEEKRNRPPTRAQQRSIMCAYLKNMKGWKPKIGGKKLKKAKAEIAQERSSKRAGEELEQESIKKHKKIHKEGKNNYYQIIRVDGSSKMYMVFSQLLESFDRQDLEDLYKLVKAKYGSTRPVEDLDLILYGDLKTMFNPHVEDRV
ncbi:hypothetical protein Tco_0413068 [Tanacetum coccineum]